MSDLVNRLRECSNQAPGHSYKTDAGDFGIFDDAADEIARLRKALEPFSIALHIAQQSLGSADVGHIEAVALRHINHAHMVGAQEAMAEGET